MDYPFWVNYPFKVSDRWTDRDRPPHMNSQRCNKLSDNHLHQIAKERKSQSIIEQLSAPVFPVWSGRLEELLTSLSLQDLVFFSLSLSSSSSTGHTQSSPSSGSSPGLIVFVRLFVINQCKQTLEGRRVAVTRV